MINASSQMIRGGTFCLSKAGLTSTPDSAVDIVSPNGAGVDFAINGVLYHAGDGTDDAITAATAQAALTSCIYLICMSAAATPVMTSVKGTEVLTADVTSGKKVLTFPQPTEGTCCIGYFRIDTDSGYTFTAATTTFGTNNTTTWVDLFAIPSSPLTS